MLRIQNQPAILHEIGPRTFEALEQIANAINALALQVGGDPSGPVPTPPAPAQLNISAANGIVNIQIIDFNPVHNPIRARLTHYFVEAASDAGFVNVVHVEHMGPTRNKNIFLGSQTLYFRAYAQLFSSPPSPWTLFGAPAAVVIGGVAPPTQQSYQGSGSNMNSGGGFGGRRTPPTL